MSATSPATDTPSCRPSSRTAGVGRAPTRRKRAPGTRARTRGNTSRANQTAASAFAK